MKNKTEKQKIRIAQYGCGKMSAYIMKYALEKDAEIVAAFDIDSKIIGKDIGEIIKCSNTGIIIQHISEADTVLATLKPDICIITTESLMRDVNDAFTVCANNGINAISTCEEAFFSWNSSPDITKKIDELAKKTGCTICGSGYQDVFWGNLITVLAGATHKIIKIKGKSSYNVEDYGISLAQAHGAGLDLAIFENEIASADNISEQKRQSLIEKGEFLPSYM